MKDGVSQVALAMFNKAERVLKASGRITLIRLLLTSLRSEGKGGTEMDKLIESVRKLEVTFSKDAL